MAVGHLLRVAVRRKTSEVVSLASKLNTPGGYFLSGYLSVDNANVVSSCVVTAGCPSFVPGPHYVVPLEC